MASLRQLQRVFGRAERDRQDAAYVYAEALRYYVDGRRSDRTRREVYPLVVRYYRELVQATKFRNRAAEDLKERAEEGVEDAGTEFELTATTEGGTPGLIAKR